MKFYNLAPGMNPRRVRIFMAEKDIDIPWVEIDMMKGENATPEFLAKNPLGKLPVLELDDGGYLSESIAICRYLEDMYPEPPLFGRNSRERAEVEMWNRRMELDLMSSVGDAFTQVHEFWKGRRTQFPDYGEDRRQYAFKIMDWLDKELADREFVAGDIYTVADITAQCALVMGKNTGTRIPEGAANLQRWFDAVSARPSARA